MSTSTTRSRPALATGERVLACWAQTGRCDLDAHLAVHGPLLVPHESDTAAIARLIEAVRASGLTGRGGAGFPTARKWDSVRSGNRRPQLVVNAMEGEPASQKDRALLSAAPHLVLDGAVLAARAIGARQITICVAHDRNDTAERVRSALAHRAGTSAGGLSVRLVQPPGRYVTGEESALVAWLAGGVALPRFRPAKGTPLTIQHRPVLVQSAETLAHVALIARHGAQWFRSAGVPDATGTCLITASGAVESPGVYEVELGTPVRSILRRAGLLPPVGAVLVGGYGGTWLHPDLLETAFAPGALAGVGSATGAGVLVVVPASSCGITETARVATYMAHQGAGQCGPCVFGLPAIARDLALLASGRSDGRHLARLRQRLDSVEGRGACRHPDGVARLVRSALAVFSVDVEGHARGRPCPAWNRPPMLPIPRSNSETGRRRS